MLLWINSDDHSKRILLSNVDHFKNGNKQSEIEPTLVSNMGTKDQCLVLSTAKREADITPTDGKTFNLKSINCISKASAICVIESNAYSPTSKRAKLPCISKSSKSRNRRDTKFGNDAESTSGNEKAQLRGMLTDLDTISVPSSYD